MAELSLRAYIEYIEDRLGRDATAEAVAQCRHILTSYPKHIDTYRILARATAVQEKYMDALDLFQRVLSADPGDFVAHIGMSECYKEDGALDQAIWHLERAFEQAPSNRDLQNELKKLYEQRDGSAPHKIQMTGGALARMYVKGKLHDQAIAELTKTLSSDPERLDLQVLLAEALWNNHQEVAAGRVAAEVLKKLPYSIDANRILGQLWLKAGQPSEARPFIDRVKELDPYTAYRVDHNGDNAPAESFRLSVLESTFETQAAQIGAADWVTEIKGIEKQKGVSGPLKNSGAITDIFAAPAAPSTPAAPVSSATPASPAAMPVDMGAPDWLKSALGTGKLQATPSTQPEWLKDVLGGQAETPPAPSAPMPSGENAPDWLKDVIQEEPPVTPSEIKGAPPPLDTAPDWLKDTLEGGTPASPLPAATGDKEAPDWLKDVTSAPPPAQPAQPAAPAPAGDNPAPAWLSDVLNEQTPTGIQKPVAADDRPKPSWLDDVLADSPAAPPPQVGPRVVTTDMLNQIITGGDAPIGSPPPTSSLSEDTAPVKFEDLGELDPWDTPEPNIDEPAPPPPSDWLEQDTGLSREEKKEPTQEESKLPDWLTSDAPVSPPREEKVETPTEAEGALPTWLTGDPADISKPKPPENKADEDQSDELPTWLAGDSVEISKPKPPESKADEEKGDELPSWLAGDSAPSAKISEPAGKAEETASDALPDWLNDKDKSATDGGKMEMESEPEGADEAAMVVPQPPSEPVEEKTVAPPDEVTPDGEQEEVPDWLSSGDLDSDDALKWLEEMAAKIDPNFVSEGAESASVKEESALAAGVSEPEAKAEPEAKEEPEGDLEWLRAPTEDKVEVEEGEEVPDWLKPEPVETEPVAKASVAPTDPDTEEALAWLDEQVKEQGVSPDKPVAESLTPDHPPVAAMPKALELDAEAEAASDDDLPDWLKDANAQEARAEALDAPDTAPDLADIPELPVEADELAWLNDALKAEEKSAGGDDDGLDDLFAEAKKAAGALSDDEKDELPDWLKGEEEAKPAPVMEEKAAPAMEAKEEPPAAKAEEAKPEEKKEESGELPDWLKSDAEETAAEGQSGLTAFLKAVEPAAEPAAAPPPPKAEPAPAPPPAPEPVAATPVAPMPIPAGEAGEKLRAAREQMSNGELQKALEIYEALVASGHGQSETISDLMEVVKVRAVVNPKVYRVIGDAMMGAGQMQEALAMYKKALDNF